MNLCRQSLRGSALWCSLFVSSYLEAWNVVFKIVNNGLFGLKYFGPCYPPKSLYYCELPQQVVVLYEYRSFWWRMTTSSFLLILEGLLVQCQKKNVWFWYWKHSFSLLHSDNWAEEESFYDLLVVVSSEVYQMSEPVISKLRSQHCKDVCWKGEG